MKSLTSRTGLLTAIAVVGVMLAGTAAIAANIGILNSTSDSSIGSLSASDDLVGSSLPTTSTTAPSTTSTSIETALTSDQSGSSYVVDDAGTVTVSATADSLTMIGTTPNPGWAVTSSQPDGRSLTVTFSDGSRTIVFTASIDANGLLTADVTEPIVVTGASPDGAAPATPTSTPDRSSSGYDDDHDDDDDDDDHDDDHDDDDHDDDHDDAYEGADDDD